MVFQCTRCEIKGDEARIQMGYTEKQCKSECLKDDDCMGIDFGIDDGRDGECYFNYENVTVIGTKHHNSFVSWRKNLDCGKISSFDHCSNKSAFY